MIIGPSAGGKSTLVRRLASDGLIRVHQTWTTRPARDDEDPTDERLEHRFVDEERFAQLESEGFFLGTTRMFGLPHQYGLPHVDRRSSGPIDAVMLRAPLVDELRTLVPDLVVYHVDTDLDEAAQRLIVRSPEEAEARARMAANEHELALGRALADRVFPNDADADALVRQVSAAIRWDWPGAPGLPPSRPAPPGRRRERSTAEKIALALAIVAATILAGLVAAALAFAWLLSQWGNNK